MLYPSSAPLAAEALAGSPVRVGTGYRVFPMAAPPLAGKRPRSAQRPAPGPMNVDYCHETTAICAKAAAPRWRPNSGGSSASPANSGSSLRSSSKPATWIGSKARGTCLVRGRRDRFHQDIDGIRSAGATVDDVKLFADHRRGTIRIKAAGGIKTLAQARALIAAGAERLGTSNAVALVLGRPAATPRIRHPDTEMPRCIS